MRQFLSGVLVLIGFGSAALCGALYYRAQDHCCRFDMKGGVQCARGCCSGECECGCGKGRRCDCQGGCGKKEVAEKYTDDQWSEFIYEHWFRAQFNVFYHEMAGNEELHGRWQVLLGKWRPIFDGDVELTDGLRRELYLEQWHIEQDEPEPDYDMLRKAHEKASEVVEQIREDRTRGQSQ